MRWKLTKYEWDEDAKSMIIGRQWFIQADRVEVESMHVLRAYREDLLVYVSRDWDEVDLVDEEH